MNRDMELNRWLVPARQGGRLFGHRPHRGRARAGPERMTFIRLGRPFPPDLIQGNPRSWPSAATAISATRSATWSFSDITVSQGSLGLRCLVKGWCSPTEHPSKASRPARPDLDIKSRRPARWTALPASMSIVARRGRRGRGPRAGASSTAGAGAAIEVTAPLAARPRPSGNRAPRLVGPRRRPARSG